MAELIHEFTTEVQDAAGVHYRVLAYGEQRADGTWIGWLVFVPSGAETVLRTDQETVQSNRGFLEYWASGLEPVYLEGALGRARARSVRPSELAK
jgi:hypothetical protein